MRRGAHASRIARATALDDLVRTHVPIENVR